MTCPFLTAEYLYYIVELHDFNFLFQLKKKDPKAYSYTFIQKDVAGKKRKEKSEKHTHTNHNM